MKLKLFFALIITIPVLNFAQKISGKVVADGSVPLQNVLVINLQNGLKTATAADGTFALDATAGQEIRFVKQGYVRQSLAAGSSDFYTVNMSPEIREIEEVKINPVKLSGNLQKDAKALAKNDKLDALRKEIGVPAPPEKPREAPSEVKNDILKPLLGIPPTLNIQAIYNVLSGKSRKQKSLYKFEDQQDLEMWILDRLGAPYFTERGIAQEKIVTFLDYAVLSDPDVTKYVKAKNIDGVTTRLEDLIPKFLTLNNKP